LAGGWVQVPDFIGRVRLDQAWGHVTAALQVRDQTVHATGTRFSKTTFGGVVSGHLNTFGKDALRAEVQAGTGLGSYLSDMSSDAGLQVSSVVGTPAVVAAPMAFGFYAGYTHWWTNELRSTLMAGYSHVGMNSSAISSALAQNALDKRHIGTTGNIIWSPVPQVDLGLEFSWIQRETQLATAGNNNKGALERLETMAVFKF
jgi:hypothetical protein